MRLRRLAFASVLFALAPFAIAEDHVSVFVSDLGHTESNAAGSAWSGSAGIGYEHVWNPHWSVRGAVAVDQRRAVVTEFVTSQTGTLPVTSRRSITTYPLDLSVRYRLLNESRWTPFFSGGAHFVAAPNNFYRPIVLEPFEPIPTSRERFSNRLSAVLGVGTAFRITSNVDLQFEVQRLLRDDSTQYDLLTRGSFGFDFRF